MEVGQERQPRRSAKGGQLRGRAGQAGCHAGPRPRSAPCIHSDPFGDTTPNQRCEKLQRLIKNLTEEIATDEKNLAEDPLHLPETHPDDDKWPSLSKRGHRRELERKRKQLDDAKEEYNGRGCDEILKKRPYPVPKPAPQPAVKPKPAPPQAPWWARVLVRIPWPDPPTADRWSRRFAIVGISLGGAAVGGTLLGPCIAGGLPGVAPVVPVLVH